MNKKNIIRGKYNEILSENCPKSKNNASREMVITRKLRFQYNEFSLLEGMFH